MKIVGYDFKAWFVTALLLILPSSVMAQQGTAPPVTKMGPVTSPNQPISGGQQPSEQLTQFQPTLGAIAGTGTGGTSSGGAAQLGLTSFTYQRTNQPSGIVLQTDLLFLAGYLNMASPASLDLASSDNGFLLNPNVQAQSFQFAGYGRAKKLFKRRDTNTLYYFRLGASFYNFKKSGSTLNDAGTILDASFGPKIRFSGGPLIDANGDVNSNANEFGLDLGLSLRRIMGTVSTASSNGKSDRSQLFGTDKTNFIGVEGTLYFRTGTAQPFLRVGYFPYGNDLPGFTGFNAFLGVNVYAALSGSNNTPSVAPAVGFTLSASPPGPLLPDGQTTSLITITPSGGFADNVDLTASIQPTTTSITPTFTKLSPTTYSLTLKAVATPVKKYTVTVNGKAASGAASASTTLVVDVSAGL